MVVVLRYRDMGKEPGPGAAARYGMIGRRCRHDGIASRVGQFFADVPDHLEPARHVFERLRDILTDPAQRAAAGGTGVRGLMQDALARQVLRKGPPRYIADAAKKQRTSERTVRREAARGAAIPDIAKPAGTSLATRRESQRYMSVR
jgi:hypothetical protein